MLVKDILSSRLPFNVNSEKSITRERSELNSSTIHWIVSLLSYCWILQQSRGSLNDVSSTLKELVRQKSAKTIPFNSQPSWCIENMTKQTKVDFKKLYIQGEFPGSPVVRTPHFHCWGPRLDPWSRELKSHRLHSAASPTKKLYIFNLVSYCFIF